MKESTGLTNKYHHSLLFFEILITSLRWSSCHGPRFCCNTEELENTREQPSPACKHNPNCILPKNRLHWPFFTSESPGNRRISLSRWAVAKLHSHFHNTQLWEHQDPVKHLFLSVSLHLTWQRYTRACSYHGYFHRALEGPHRHLVRWNDKSLCLAI